MRLATKKTRWAWGCAVLSVVLFAGAVAGALVLRPDWRFRCKDMLAHIGSGIALKAVDPQEYAWRQVTRQALEKDPSIMRNQALMLISPKAPLAEDFRAQVSEYKDTGVWMNDCIQDAYAALAADVYERYGEKLFVRSAYRTAEEQAAIALEQGNMAARAGASEHQAGLALDVYVRNFAGAAFTKAPAGQYVNLYGWQYGFIIRYPYGKSDITGIGYEPWHIRYTGLPHAEIMEKNRWTLEEYLEALEENTYYLYDGILFSRQTGDTVALPEGRWEIACSPDNLGGVVVTAVPE